jgi:Ca-activated chloride channel family protein
MGDERKIDYAKEALRSLIRQLSSEDVFSLVTYDDLIEVPRPARRVGNDKRELLRMIDEIYPRGSTNLGGGMTAGYQQVERHANKEYTNRVVLLSDGLANQGITDPYRLNGIARKKRAHAVSLTTMGVGLEYNENLMVGLAEHGGGNYYFIETPRPIAHILHREFESLSATLAQNAIIELRLGRGVTLRDIIGYQWTQEGDVCKIAVGDLVSDATNELTLELVAPSGRGSLALASGKLMYESDKLDKSELPTFATTVDYTDKPEVVEEHRDLDIQAKADVAVSTRKVEEAMQMLDEGRADDAAKTLSEAKEVLSASPAASAAGAGGTQLRNQAAQIGSFESMVKDSTGDMRRAKKAIQYDNYRTQKNK